VPNDQYKVVAVADENTSISTLLQEVCKKVMNVTYDNSGEHMILYTKIMILSSEQVVQLREVTAHAKRDAKNQHVDA
jgi:hypothetical protein